MSEVLKENLNLNTALLALIVGLSGWTLKSVTEQGEQMAALAVKVQNLERVVYTTAR